MVTDTAGTRHNVWIINHYAVHPVGSSGGTRHHSLALAIREHGWTTTIFAATTAHSTRVQRPAETFAAPETPGISWKWIKCPDYAHGSYGRIRNIAAFTLRIILKKSTSRAARPDVVIGSSVHPFAAWAAHRLAKRHKVPFIFEVRDLWPETLIEMGAIRRNGVVAKSMRSLERKLYEQSATIITTMPYAYRYIESLGIPRDKVRWLANGTEVAAFRPSPPPRNKPFRFLYYGSHGHANNLSTVIDAFISAEKELPANSVSLTLVGDGPLKSSLKKQAEAKAAPGTIFFKDAVHKSRIPQLSASADALIISILPLALYNFGISHNKLSDYLASHRPILLCGNPANNPVRDASAGISVPGNDIAQISHAMTRMVRSTPQQRDEWGRNGYAHAVSDYAYGSLGEVLTEILNDVVERPTDEGGPRRKLGTIKPRVDNIPDDFQGRA